MSEYHLCSRLTTGVDLAGILGGRTDRSRSLGLGRRWGPSKKGKP